MGMAKSRTGERCATRRAMYDRRYLTHKHTHAGTFTCVACACILVDTTDSSAQSEEGEKRWIFEHYSTDTRLLCDCGQLMAEDINESESDEMV